MFNIEEIDVIDKQLNELYKLRISGKFGVIEYHMRWTNLLRKKAQMLDSPKITVSKEETSVIRKIG